MLLGRPTYSTDHTSTSTEWGVRSTRGRSTADPKSLQLLLATEFSLSHYHQPNVLHLKNICVFILQSPYDCH